MIGRGTYFQNPTPLELALKKEEQEDRETATKWIQFGIMALGAPLFGYAYWQFADKSDPNSRFKVQHREPTGQALVGGSWTMVDFNGRPRCSAEFNCVRGGANNQCISDTGRSANDNINGSYAFCSPQNYFTAADDGPDFAQVCGN